MAFLAKLLESEVKSATKRTTGVPIDLVSKGTHIDCLLDNKVVGTVKDVPEFDAELEKLTGRIFGEYKLFPTWISNDTRRNLFLVKPYPVEHEDLDIVESIYDRMVERKKKYSDYKITISNYEQLFDKLTKSDEAKAILMASNNGETKEFRQRKVEIERVVNKLSELTNDMDKCVDGFETLLRSFIPILPLDFSLKS
jgi:phage anti-repressor protein